MTPETQKLLEEALKSSLAALQSGAEFAKEQIPLILQEKLAYDFYYYLFFSIIWTLIWSTSIFYLRWSIKTYHASKSYDREGWLVGGWCGLVGTSIVYLIALTNNIPAMIQIHLAPRLYLLEWLRTFITK